jgi:hypothetical protein
MHVQNFLKIFVGVVVLEYSRRETPTKHEYFDQAVPVDIVLKIHDIFLGT